MLGTTRARSGRAKFGFAFVALLAISAASCGSDDDNNGGGGAATTAGGATATTAAESAATTAAPGTTSGGTEGGGGGTAEASNIQKSGECGMGTGEKASGDPIKLGGIATNVPGIDFTWITGMAKAYFDCVNDN